MTCEAATLETMKVLVREMARPQPGENQKSALDRVGRWLTTGYTRARDHFYGRARSVPAHEWLAAHEALMRSRRERAARLRAELAMIEGQPNG